MGKTIKWLVIIITGLITLCIIAVFSLPFIINPNDYKDKISTIVKDKTGRDLSIPGVIKLHVSPKLDMAFSLGEIQLGPGPEFSGTPFASSKLAEIKLALWPLLTKKELQINTIDLQGVQLDLIKNRQGKTNWDDLAGTADSQTHPPSKNRQETSTQPQDKNVPILDIGGIHIRDINVNYLDEQTNTTISLTNFNLDVGHLQEDIAFPLSADFTFAFNDNKQPVTATISAGGELSFNLAGKYLTLNNFDLKGVFEGEMFPGERLELALLIDADIDAGKEKINLNKLIFSQGEMRAETVLTLNNFSTPSIAGTITIPEYSPKNHLKKLGITLPEFADVNALNVFSTTLNFNLIGDRFELKDLVLTLDDTTIKANATVSNLKAPSYVLNMDIDQLDLDRYAVQSTSHSGQPEEKSPSSAGVEPAVTATDSKPILPVQLLKELDFNGDVRIHKLKADKLNLSEVQLKTEGKDGLILLQPLGANLYEGSLTVTGVIDVRPEIPAMRLKKTLHKVQLGPMCMDMLGREEFSGQADINVEVATKGLDKEALIKNSNGTLKLSLTDGHIAKLQILQTIRIAKALLDKKIPAPVATTQPTGFATLTASGTLTNGVFVNNDLLAESDLMKVTGKGKVDLVTEQVDYLLTVYLTDRIERDQDTGLVALGNMSIPYHVKGNFAELQQSASIGELAKAKAEEVLLESLEKQFDSGGDEKEKPALDTGSLINQGLKGLFGN